MLLLKVLAVNVGIKCLVCNAPFHALAVCWVFLAFFNVSEPHLRFQRRHRATSFQVARGLHRFTWTNCFCMTRTFRQTGNGPSHMHSGPQGKSEFYVQREPTGRVIIVIVYDREEKREEKSARDAPLEIFTRSRRSLLTSKQ